MALLHRLRGPSPPPTTMRRRILLLTVTTAGLVLAAFAVPLVVLLNHAARDIALDRATDTAHAVADYASASPTDHDALRDYVDRLNRRDDTVPVQVILPDGTHLGATLPSDATNVARPGDADRDDAGGHHTTSPARVDSIAHGELVVISVSGGSGGTIDVLAYASFHVMHAWVYERLAILAGAALVLLALAVLAAQRVSSHLVRGLQATARAADGLADGDLSARAPVGGPAEVRRVALALNGLADRIDGLIATERETVADLSHRLRTPLTAVRLDVEALPESSERAELERHVDLLERTLTAVIHAARRPEREGALPRCDAANVARERVGFWGPLLEDQGRRVALELPDGPLTVHCAEADLAAAIDALLENVVAHTPEAVPVAVAVRTERQPSGVQLVVVEVRDGGPGIPHGALGRGRSDRSSTGLGLDIARACAEGTGGRLHIERADGWTVVGLHLLGEGAPVDIRQPRHNKT